MHVHTLLFKAKNTNLQSGDEKAKVTCVQTMKSNNIFVLVCRNLSRRNKIVILFKSEQSSSALLFLSEQALCWFAALLSKRNNFHSDADFCYLPFAKAKHKPPSLSLLGIHVYVPSAICFSWLLFFPLKLVPSNKTLYGLICSGGLNVWKKVQFAVHQ